jgi:hypothetical protein
MAFSWDVVSLLSDKRNEALIHSVHGIKCKKPDRKGHVMTPFILSI